MSQDLDKDLFYQGFYRDRSKESYAVSLGKEITKAVMNGDELRIGFTDGSSFILSDDGQSCCESRYMTTDDDLDFCAGATFLGIELRDGPDFEDEHGDCHETQFLYVNTSRGGFTVVTHNEHNGYYGGFSIQCEVRDLPEEAV